MSYLKTIAAVFLKDVRVEIRTRESLISGLLLSVLLTTLAALSYADDSISAQTFFPAVLWCTVAYSGTLTIARVWNHERDADAFLGLIGTGADPSAIFLAKALYGWIFNLLISLTVVPLAGLFFQTRWSAFALPLFGLLALATFGFAMAGALFSSIRVRKAKSDVLLSVLVFPLTTPALLCGVSHLRNIMMSDASMHFFSSPYVRLLIAYDLVMLAVAPYLSGFLLED